MLFAHEMRPVIFQEAIMKLYRQVCVVGGKHDRQGPNMNFMMGHHDQKSKTNIVCINHYLYIFKLSSQLKNFNSYNNTLTCELKCGIFNLNEK